MGKECVRCKTYYEDIRANFHKKKNKFKSACKPCINISAKKEREKSKPKYCSDDREKYNWRWGE